MNHCQVNEANRIKEQWQPYLTLRVSQTGTGVYSVLDAGFGLSMVFYCEGKAGEVSGFLGPNGARKSIARTRRELVSAGRDVAANLT